MRDKQPLGALASHIKGEQEKKDFLAGYSGLKTILEDSLERVIRSKLDASTKSSSADYESPSWAYRQADKVGYERALVEVLALLP